MRRVGAWCLWAAWVLAPSLVRAQDEPPLATLVFEQAASADRCVDEEALRDLVAARLGRDPFVEAAPLHVEVTITSSRPGYLAVIETQTEGAASGRREIRSSRTDCRDLGDALALALSLAVDPASLMRPAFPRGEADADVDERADPDADERADVDERADPDVDERADADPDADPGVDANAEADVDPTPDAPIPDAPTPRTAAPHALLTAALLASWGVAPGVSGGLALGAGVRLDAFSIALEARAELPTSERSVRGAPFVGALVPCGHIDVVMLCGVFSAGAFWGEGLDVPEARSATTPYLALGARGGVEVPLGGEDLVLRLYGEATVPLIGAELQVGAERVWETPAVGLALGVGIGARVR